MLEGWPFIYKVVVSLLSLLEDELLNCKDIYELNDTVVDAKSLNVFASI